MTERVLTQRELNRALLARQLLLERAPLTVSRALERVAGLHAQGVESTYVALWSRLDGFRREDLTRALVRRSAVRGRLMRHTLHIVSARDYEPFEAAIRTPLLDWLWRAHRVDADADRMRLVTVPPAGTWGYHGRAAYVQADDWLRRPRVDPGEGLVHLVRRYLAAFGPATPADVRSWAGLKRTHIDPVFETLDLRRFRDERGRTLLDLPRAPLPPAETPASPRFLLRWDNLYFGHEARARERVIPEPYRQRVIKTNAVLPPTFLVDGFLAGTWRIEKSRVRLEPFGRLSRSDRADLAEEGERLARFLAET